MPPSPIRVLFIAGAGRTGSTLLDTTLGQVDGLTSVGELRYIWQRGFVEDRLCGCGEAFSTCPFWREVTADALGSPPTVDPRRMAELLRERTRMRRLPSFLARRSARRGAEGDLERSTSALYRAIRDRGTDVIVDSSKLPTYGRFVEGLAGIDLAVVHLVRDPRATAFSWTRARQLPDRPGGLMQRQRPAKSAALWTVWNLVTERMWAGGDRYLRLRYEDFVRSPRSASESILHLIGAADRKLPFRDDRTVELLPTHTVAGNPSRFHHGAVEIRADEEWRTALRSSARRVVETITSPALRRYGYGRTTRSRRV
jgi:Sulfotransferase family